MYSLLTIIEIRVQVMPLRQVLPWRKTSNDKSTKNH